MHKNLKRLTESYFLEVFIKLFKNTKAITS